MIYLNNRKINEAKIGLKDKYDWAKLGYSGEPQFINDGYNYALEMQKRWNEHTTNDYSSFFQNDEKVVFMPKLEITKPESDLGYVFDNCKNLQYLEPIDCTNIIGLNSAFRNTDIRELTLLNTENVFYFSSFADNCKNLSRISPISIASSRNFSISNSENLRELEIKDFGGNSRGAILDMYTCIRWGNDNSNNEYPNAAQSVRNTLFNAFDRQAAGFRSGGHIRIPPTALTLFTIDEKKAICAKKYDLNTVDYNLANEDLRIHYTCDFQKGSFIEPINEYNIEGKNIWANEVDDYINAIWLFITDYNKFQGFKMPKGIIELKKMPKITYTTLERTFESCSLIKKIDLGNLIDLSTITEMYYTFNHCVQVEEINLTGIKPTNFIIPAYKPFNDCPLLKTIKMIGATPEDVQWLKDMLVESRIPEGQVTIVTA